MMQFAVSSAYSESYEDFMEQRDSNNRNVIVANTSSSQRTDVPLADIRIEHDAGVGQEETRVVQRVDFLEDLRGAVRDEIDSTMNKERKAQKEGINEDRLIRDVRRIVKEEIEDAIRIKEMKYSSPGTLEMGVTFSREFNLFSSRDFKDSSKFQIQPLINYFLFDGFGFSLKGGADISVTDISRSWGLCTGPIFAFGLNRDETIHFFTGIYAGISSRSNRTRTSGTEYGFCYSNEFGLKFVLSSGVLLSTSITTAFDVNTGSTGDKFRNVIMPMIGITAWF